MSQNRQNSVQKLNVMFVYNLLTLQARTWLCETMAYYK